MLKALVMVTCDFVMTQPLMASKQFQVLNVIHEAKVNLWYGF